MGSGTTPKAGGGPARDAEGGSGGPLSSPTLGGSALPAQPGPARVPRTAPRGSSPGRGVLRAPLRPRPSSTPRRPRVPAFSWDLLRPPDTESTPGRPHPRLPATRPCVSPGPRGLGPTPRHGHRRVAPTPPATGPAEEGSQSPLVRGLEAPPHCQDRPAGCTGSPAPSLLADEPRSLGLGGQQTPSQAVEGSRGQRTD